MNALEKVVDLLMAIVLLFLVPILYYGGEKRISQAVLVGQAGETFLTRVSTSGEITLPVWEELETELIRYGCKRFELQRERRLFEPTETVGNIVERIYTEQKETMEEQVRADGRIRLQRGDRIRLILYVNDIPTVYSDWVRTGATDT